MHPYLVKLSQGVFHYTRKGHDPSQLGEAARNLDVPQGASAGDSAMIVAYLAELAGKPGFKPDLAVVQVGLHDIKTHAGTGERQVSQADFERNILAIAKWFKERKIALAWMTAGPLDEGVHNAKQATFRRYEADVDAINYSLKKLAGIQRQPLIDLAGFTKGLGPTRSLLSDHVHFNDEVVQKQAAFVVLRVREILEKGLG